MTSKYRIATVSSVLAAQLFVTSAWAQLPPPPPPSSTPPPAASSGAAAAPVVAPPLSPVPAPTQAELQHRRVAVTIDSDHEGTVIERRVSREEAGGTFVFFIPYRGFKSEWEQVCVTPCRTELDRYSTYRVGEMNEVSSTRGFTLPQGNDALRLHIEAGNLMKNRFGKALVGIGSAAIIVGASLLIGAHSFKHEDDARLAGAITGGGGIVFVGIGIPLILMSRSKVSDGERKLAEIPIGKSGAAITPSGFVF